jgi:hypothetical protein
MKIATKIAAAFLKLAKDFAQSRGTDLRAFVERGLRPALSEQDNPVARFKLPDASVGGKGLHPDAVAHPWDELRARSYGVRGGD